jgi:hypothetical protein
MEVVRRVIIHTNDIRVSGRRTQQGGRLRTNPHYIQVDRTDHPSVLEKRKISYLCRDSIHDLSVVVVRNIFRKPSE